MTSFLLRRALSRRTFLRGAGAALALPWLDAMAPRLCSPAAVRRCMFVFAPNGKKMDDWRPQQEGADYELPFLLEPLAAHKARMLVLTGLDLDGGKAHGDGPGDHARAAASFLTTAHPKKTGGEDIANGVSIDQVIAASLQGTTRFASLELGMEKGKRAGSCDSGYSCAYSHHIAWSGPATPVTNETDPRALFERLFGDPNALLDAEAERAAARRRRSVLDAVAGDARSLSRELGGADRAKLGEYMDSVRAVEQRLAATESGDAAAVDVPAALRTGADKFEDQLDLMYELCALAFATDQTRVITLMLGNAGSSRSYRFLGVPEGHHDLSHHRGDADKVAKIRRINRWHMERFAAFCDRLASARDGDADLLENAMVMYGAGLADGNAHAHVDLPIVLLGRGAGSVDSGKHVRSKPGTPLGNLYVSLQQRMGVAAESFGDSTGALL